MNKPIKRLLHASLFLTILVLPLAGNGADSFADCRMVSNAELDELRGGFDTNINGTQLKLAFSLESVTFVNGQLAATTRLNLPDLSALASGNVPVSFSSSAGSAPLDTSAQPNLSQQQLSNIGKNITVVQNGVGNSLALPQSLNSLGTVIQNSLDNQLIRNQTTLNITLANQGLARSMQLGSVVNEGLARSVR